LQGCLDLIPSERGREREREREGKKREKAIKRKKKEREGDKEGGREREKERERERRRKKCLKCYLPFLTCLRITLDFFFNALSRTLPNAHYFALLKAGQNLDKFSRYYVHR
jgi:hypothetical protein